MDFLKFGRWNYIPREWFTDPSAYPDLVFEDIGRGIAFGEQKHIVDTILANTQVSKRTLEIVNYPIIREVINKLFSEIHEPRETFHFSMFAPIKYFVAMNTDWVRNWNTRIQLDTLLVNGFDVKILWSNRYLDYDDFIILEKSLCRWIAKPNVRNRLEVDIRESEKPEKMELKAQTVFNFAVLEPKKIRILHPTQIPDT